MASETMESQNIRNETANANKHTGSKIAAVPDNIIIDPVKIVFLYLLTVLLAFNSIKLHFLYCRTGYLKVSDRLENT